MMNCPNCNEFMDGLSMSGNDTRITHEFYCNHCHTYSMYSYNPEVTDKILNQDYLKKLVKKMFAKRDLETLKSTSKSTFH